MLIEKEQNELKGNVSKILQLLQNSSSSSSSQGTTETVPSRHLVKGRNVMAMATSCRDGYSFGLDLLDMMFTPEELSGSLVYEPKPTKSKKKGLDKVKVICTFSFLLFQCMYCGIIQVEHLMELVQEKFPETNFKTLVLKLNQKCRDKSRGGRKNIRPVVNPVDGVTDG